MACGGEGDRLVGPFDVREPASGREVVRAHRHHECRRGAAERRQCAGRGDGVEDRGERVVLFLRPGAVVGRRGERRVGIIRVDGLRAVAGSAEQRPDRRDGTVDLRVQHTVERPLELSGDLRQHVSTHRVQSVAARPDSDPSLAHRPILARFGSVLIQVHRPDGRESTELLCGCRRRGIRTLPPCGGGDLFVGGMDSGRSRAAGEQRPGDRDDSVDADFDRGEGRAHRGQSRRKDLPDVSATGRTTARAAFTRSPAPIFDTLVVRCTNSLVERHPNRVVIRSAFKRPSDLSHTCAVASTSSASPARVIRAAADRISSTSRSDQPCASSPAKTSPTSPARWSPTFSSVAAVLFIPPFWRGPPTSKDRQRTRSDAETAPVQTPDPSQAVEEPTSRAQPRNTVCTSPTTSRPPSASSSISTAVPDDDDAELGEQLMRRGQRPAGREHVVHEQHPRAGGEVVVHLDRRLAVLERVRDGCRRPRQLAGLAHRNQAHARGDRDRAREQEPARLDPRDDVERARERRGERVDRGAQAPASASSGVMSRNRMPGSG